MAVGIIGLLLYGASRKQRATQAAQDAAPVPGGAAGSRADNAELLNVTLPNPGPIGPVGGGDSTLGVAYTNAGAVSG